jgi:uncharacterized protein with PIN domain
VICGTIKPQKSKRAKLEKRRIMARKVKAKRKPNIAKLEVVEARYTERTYALCPHCEWDAELYDGDQLLDDVVEELTGRRCLVKCPHCGKLYVVTGE